MKIYGGKIAENGFKKREIFFRRNFLLSFLTLFLLFTPAYIQQLPYAFFFTYLRLFIAVFWGIKILAGKKISFYCLLVCFYYVLLIISTAFNKGTLFQTIWGSIIGLTGVFYIERYAKQRKHDLLFTVYSYFLLCVVLSIITFIVWPNGLYYNGDVDAMYHFLGNYNTIINHVIPMAIAGICYSETYYCKNTKNIMVIVLIASLYMFFCSKALTSFIITALIIVAVFLLKARHWDLFLNLPAYITTIILSFFILIFYREPIRYIASLLVSAGKDITFSGRTIIWDYAIYWIKNAPILGNGAQTSEFILKRFGDGIVWGADHAHNMFLQVAYLTGYSGFIIFFLIVMAVIINIYKMEDKKMKRTQGLITFALFLGFLVEVMSFTFIFFLFALLIAVCKNYKTCYRK